MPENTEPKGAFGNSRDQWRDKLTRGLNSGEYAELKSVLLEFGKELKTETTMVSRFNRSPLLDRLLEQARRFVSQAPTEIESLKQELTSERQLWASFRQKYREKFVPENLHPYLDDLAVLVTPSTIAPQYEGFGKFTGFGTGNRPVAVTLFDQHQSTPDEYGYEKLPNFYTSYLKYEKRFIIHRAYRGDLPRGSGEECLFEHLITLNTSPSDLVKLTVENVQNAETYRVFVLSENGETKLVADPVITNAPLVRLSQRLIKRSGQTMGEAKVSLDSFGFLDLHIEVLVR